MLVCGWVHAIGRHCVSDAIRAAGAVVMAVDMVMGGEVENAFCAIRPPGHHAEKASAMGFCFINNVAVGATHAAAEHGLERIAIIDFDVHHGNGTEDIFHNEPRVLFCSSFQHPFFPHSDIGAPGAHMIKTPLDAGTGSLTFRERVGAEWLERLDAFEPELLMISAGFDAHWQDDLADLNLNERDYGWLTGELRELADDPDFAELRASRYSEDAFGF